MRKLSLVLILLFALANADPQFTITGAKNVHCDPTGKGRFDLTISSESTMPTLQFGLTLKPEEGDSITATCYMGDIPTDLASSTDNLSGESDSDSLSDTAFVSDQTDSMEVSSDSDSTRIRLLQSISSDNIAVCIYEPPEEEGEYTLDSTDNAEIGVEKDLKVTLITCMSLDEAKDRMNIRLSFRQVNSFDASTYSFMFYGFTSADIPGTTEIEFKILAMKGFEKIAKVTAKCKVKDGKDVTVDTTRGIAPVAFECSFEEEKDKVAGYEYIIILSSPHVAGFPWNKNFLNPWWIDMEIAAGRLVDVSTISFIPLLLKFTFADFDLHLDKGYFKLEIPFTEEGGIKVKIGDFCKFPLAFPTGIFMKVIIIGFKNGMLKLKFEIQGAIDNQPLIWEQTVISFGGVEFFVLPGFETEPITTEGTSPDDDEEDQEGEEEPMTLEDALERAKIFISFRQLNGFFFDNSTYSITFNFYGYATQDLTGEQKIELKVNLININGVTDYITKAECVLLEDVSLGSKSMAQANFNCSMEDLYEDNYTSLRLNKTDDVAGIPEDEALLNPVLTDEAIAEGEMKNCTEDSSIPPLFNITSLEEASCSSDGKFIFKGKLSEDKQIPSKFTIPLTYPSEGITLTCTYESEEIQCVADQAIDNTTVLEQYTVSEGSEDLFIIKSFVANMSCANGLLKEAENKTNVNISFRQVSHIEKVDAGITFFFAAFVNQIALESGYTVEMNVIFEQDGQKIPKIANCVLSENVEKSDEPVQGNFQCTVSLESGENFSPENLTISKDNENIGGCAELTEEEASPNATDAAISEAENAESDLALAYDCSQEENQNYVPPTFTISNVNIDNCENRGRITVTGSFSEKIENETTFELPLSFPASTVKCTVDQAEANAKVEMDCKIQKVKKFSKFKQFIIEPRLLKNKRKEMFYIEKFASPEVSEKSCRSFNKIKLDHARKKKNAHLGFLLFGPPPSGFLFFLALMKVDSSATFNSITLEATITTEASRLRLLDESTAALKCEAGATTENTGIVNCKGDGSTPSKIDLTDSKVAGTPDDGKIESNPAIDASNLATVDSLSSFNITSIEKGNCQNNGSYIIKAECTSDQCSSFTKSKITIPFSSPDSKGLCEVNSKGKEVTMYCENTQKFETPAEMIIHPQMIFDDDDTTPLFKINQSYTARTPFACVVSDKSLKVPFSNTRSGTSSSGGSYPGKKSSSSGLSGGAIAGIVIACVAAVAIVGTIIVLAKKGVFSSKAASDPVDVNSTVNRFSVKENANIV